MKHLPHPLAIAPIRHPATIIALATTTAASPPRLTYIFSSYRCVLVGCPQSASAADSVRLGRELSEDSWVESVGRERREDATDEGEGEHTIRKRRHDDGEKAMLLSLLQVWLLCPCAHALHGRMRALGTG